MIRGIYAAAAGMLTAMERLDVSANNVANVDTNGFKRELVRTLAQPEHALYRVEDSDPRARDVNNNSIPQYIGNATMGVNQIETWTNFEPGPLLYTGNPLDVALTGKGFFTIAVPAGPNANDVQLQYTRDGSFTIDKDRFLVTKDGFKVIGIDNQPINLAKNDAGLASDQRVEFNSKGEVFSNGQLAGQLLIVDFPQDQPPRFEPIERFPYLQKLQKVGRNRYVANVAPVPLNAKDKYQIDLLKPRSLERSNVNSIANMATMISNMRSYEMAAKAIQLQDSLTDRAVNQLGVVKA